MDIYPTKQAQERARRDPQPGDRWEEMLHSWVHVDARDGERVLTRMYIGPCTIRPEEARQSIWHETLQAFADYVRGSSFVGNRTWSAVIGGHYAVEGDGLFDRPSPSRIEYRAVSVKPEVLEEL